MSGIDILEYIHSQLIQLDAEASQRAMCKSSMIYGQHANLSRVATSDCCVNESVEAFIHI